MERLIQLYGYILCAALIVSLANADTNMPENYNITSTSVIVNWFESELELQAELGDFEIAGMADCEYRPEFNVSFCEFWLVRPLHLEDEYNFDTIGHEFYHALVGDFHD